MFESIFGVSFSPNKTKTQLRLCVSRIKLLQNKKTIMTRQQRKDIAKLLASGKEDSARIRVEALIQEESLMIAYEILELYCELLSVRVELMKLNKGLPEDMQESVASVIYAAQRCSAQLPELAVVKTQLKAKYGKEYVQRAQSDDTCLSEQVNPRLIESLAIKVPSPKKKVALLSEIALEHNVDWEVVQASPEEDAAPSASAEAATDTSMDAKGGGPPPLPRKLDANIQYPHITFSDEPPSPTIAVGTPVHVGEEDPAPPPAPPTAKAAPPSAPPVAGEPSSSASHGVDDLPDTPSPVSLNINIVDVPEPAAGEQRGGMDELSKRLDALKTGGQMPKPPKDF